MATAKGAPELSLALARATSRPGLGAHVPSKTTLLLIVIGVAAVCYFVYRVSLWLHPFVMCRRCGGSGKIIGFLSWSRAFCYKCNGTGLVPRLGTRVTDLRGRHLR
jgi:hypothetical protein